MYIFIFNIYLSFGIIYFTNSRIPVDFGVSSNLSGFNAEIEVLKISMCPQSGTWNSFGLGTHLMFEFLVFESLRVREVCGVTTRLVARSISIACSFSQITQQARLTCCIINKILATPTSIVPRKCIR